MPSAIYAGETLTLLESWSDYPASAGWTAVAIFRNGAEKKTVNLTADGDSFGATVTADETATWPPGLWDEFLIFTHASAGTHTRGPCQLAVKPNPAAEGEQLTALEQQLVKIDEAIDAVVSGKGVQAYTIQTAAGGSRQIQRMPLEELRQHRRWLEGKIDAERVSLGEKPKNQRWKRIGVRFPQ